MIVLKTTQEKVLAALQAVAGIVERRHTLPILANVLIRKSGSQIELTTSDLEIQVRTTADFGCPRIVSWFVRSSWFAAWYARSAPWWLPRAARSLSPK